MSTAERWQASSEPPASEGSYSRQIKDAQDISEYTSKHENMQDMSENMIFSEYKEKIHNYHIKDAKYSAQMSKLNKENDYLRNKLNSLNLKVTKLEEHRAQDAEALLDQEDKMNSKGRYKTSDNPNEISKLKKSQDACFHQYNDTLNKVRKNWDKPSSFEPGPSFDKTVRKLKYHASSNQQKQSTSAMNEILFRQIEIYLERLSDKNKEYENLKSDLLSKNESIRKYMIYGYKSYDDQKSGMIEDSKSLYTLERKAKFYQSDVKTAQEAKMKK